MAKQTVCIIGAGPGGLVAAKVLKQTQQFEVTVFEKAPRLGGIWALDQQSKDGFLTPTTSTNLSRFQVAFSDLAWQSICLKDDLRNGEKQFVPMFPKAWQVNRYLETYRSRYLPDVPIHFNARVTTADRDHGPSHDRWLVTTIDKSGKEQKHKFDKLIMASGFFASPRPIRKVIERMPTNLQDIPIKVVHSTQMRQLEDLLPVGSNGRDILIIGGSNSAGEAAGVVGTQLSNAQYSADATLRNSYRGCRLHHVTPKPLYAVPLITPTDHKYHTYAPLDFGFYNLAKRSPGPIVAAAGIAPDFVRDMLHTGLRTSVGDQSDLGATALVAPEEDDKKRGTVQVALTEPYAEFVRSGLIQPIRGKVSSVTATNDHVTAEIEHEGHTTTITNIGAILYATGYTPAPALDILDAETKAAIQFDSESMRLPMILDEWQTQVASVPDLAFQGFYEGPYWGIMEMQARLTADRWLNKDKICQRVYEMPQTLLELRAAMQERQLNVPQYWFGDYAGYMEEIAEAIKLQRNDGRFQPREGPVVPARYLYTGDDRDESDTTMHDLYQTWLACQNGRYVARAAFRALQGNWNITRIIESRNNVLPSGILSGNAAFHPRHPPTDFDFEYLYIETGVFKTVDMSMNATRRYAYRYNEERDEISVWFVKPDNDYEVDYLFHNLMFSLPEVSEQGSARVATADHLCVKDMYRTEYRMPLKGVSLSSFSITHSVTGPEKDYTAKTSYGRPALDLK